jgi:hypothetical protein
MPRLKLDGYEQPQKAIERLVPKLDRMLWRDVEREFNFKAAMRGKALIKKREKAR